MGKIIRLQKLISHYGYASRRNAEKLIEEGRVKVNGVTITRPGTKVDENSVIEIDGSIINRKVKKIYIALNKPVGYLCSKKPEGGKRTIFSLIDKNYISEGIFNIGRLDFNSRGLLLLTNDGDFANFIMHPSNMVEKEYTVTTDSDVDISTLEKWKSGIFIKGERYRIIDFCKLGSKKYSILLNEGKKREIRVLFSSAGVKVLDLIRVRIGSIELGYLKEGEYRILSEDEIKKLYKNRRY